MNRHGKIEWGDSGNPDLLGRRARWPNPDPVAMHLGPGEDEQPHIHRLTRLGVEAGLQGRGLAFIDSVSRLIFGGTKSWDQGDHLAKAAARASLDLVALDAALLADPGKYDSIIAENERGQEAAGHWGVPLMVYEGEPFFGQDRIDLLLWRMGKGGSNSAAAGT